MSEYIALYRRYRPSTFDGLIGQEHVVKTLVNQIKSSRLGHAYLFSGTRGTGKTSAAKIFAKAINCLNPTNGSPCGKCEVCKALNDPSNIDIMEIDAASNNGVNEIRDLRENVQYPPVSCTKKVYIIDEVHMLTGAAFNALLKTLEEPPKHAVFILATTEVHKIPATILSRCMRFDFRLVPTERIASLISQIYDSEGRKYDKEAINAIAKAGEGSVRDALSIADICISSDSKILSYNDVMAMIGSTNREILYSYLNAVFSDNISKVMEIVDDLCSQGKSIGVLVKDITTLLRDLIIVKNCSNPNKILNLPDSHFNDLDSLSKKANLDRILYTLQVFTDIENNLRYSNNPRIIFETASIKACRPETDYNIDAILARIKTVEDEISNAKERVRNVAEYNVTEEKQAVKLNVDSVSLAELKGKILSGLRILGREMLWNIMQPVNVTKNGNLIYLNVDNEADFYVLSKEESINNIKQSLSSFEDFEISVVLTSNEKKLNEIDNATEQIKKIFGDDIVIIKN